MTSLHYAAKMGYIDIVNLLVSHGVDIHLRDKNGFNASYWADSNKYKDIVEILGAPKTINGEELLEFKLQMRELHGMPPLKLKKKKKKKKKKK